MSQRSLSSTAEDIELEELQDLSVTQLKRRLTGKPPLVVVRSREIDTAGEHGLHFGTFDQTLALLRSAISLLSQAGIEQFVITSDHGFLLQDATAESIPLGASMRVPSRRLLDAQQARFVTSFVVVSDNDLHFHKFDELYRKVVSGLSTPACAQGARSATSSTAGSAASKRDS